MAPRIESSTRATPALPGQSATRACAGETRVQPALEPLPGFFPPPGAAGETRAFFRSARTIPAETGQAQNDLAISMPLIVQITGRAKLARVRSLETRARALTCGFSKLARDFRAAVAKLA